MVYRRGLSTTECLPKGGMKGENEGPDLVIVMRRTFYEFIDMVLINGDLLLYPLLCVTIDDYVDIVHELKFLLLLVVVAI